MGEGSLGAAVISVHRAADRFVSEYDGIRSAHCFSAGPHYDPANTSFRGLIAVDEHEVPVGGGFAPHAHRGVDIVTWVLAGVLRHEDGAGVVDVVPGQAQLQVTGPGVRHSEVNGGAVPLRFVQMALLHDAGEVSLCLSAPPLRAGDARFEVHRAGAFTADGPVHLFVAGGAFALGDTVLGEGDSARADEPLTVEGTGELLIWQLP